MNNLEEKAKLDAIKILIEAQYEVWLEKQIEHLEDGYWIPEWDLSFRILYHVRDCDIMPPRSSGVQALLGEEPEDE